MKMMIQISYVLVFSVYFCSTSIVQIKQIENAVVPLNETLDFGISIPMYFSSNSSEPTIFLSFDEDKGLPSFLSAFELPPIPLTFYNTEGLFTTIFDIKADLPYLYLTSGSSKLFAIFDLHDIMNPVHISDYSDIGNVMHFVLDGDLAYLTVDNKGLRVVNISDKFAPRLVNTGPGVMNHALNLDKDGDFVYVCDYSSLLKIHNVSDPMNIQIVGIIEANQARDVKVVGDYAYIANTDSFFVSNISNIESPKDFPKFHGAIQTMSIEMKGDEFALLSDFSGPAFRIFDVRIKEVEPILIASRGELTQSHSLSLGGPGNNYTFVAGEGVTYGIPGVGVYDITDIHNPVFKWFLPLAQHPYSSHIQNNYLFVGSMNGFDVFEFGSWKIEGSSNSPNDCGSWMVDVIVRDNSGSKLTTSFNVTVIGSGNVIDIFGTCSVLKCFSVFSNDTNEGVCHGHGMCTFTPNSELGKCDCDEGYSGLNCSVESPCFPPSHVPDLLCSGHGVCTNESVCVCDVDHLGFSGYIGQFCSEVQTKSEIILIQPLEPQTIELGEHLDMKILINEHFLVHNQQDVLYFGTEKLGIALPKWASLNDLEPSRVSYIDTARSPYGYESHFDMFVDLPYVYIPYLLSGNVHIAVFYVWDVSNPVLINDYKTNPGGQHIYVEDGFLYRSRASFFEVLDVTNPLDIKLYGSVDVGFGMNTRDIDKQGDFVYVCDTGGMQMFIINVSNPAQPSVSSSLSGYSFRDVKVSEDGEYAYSAAVEDFVVMNVTDKKSPTFLSNSKIPVKAVRLAIKDDEFCFVEDYTAHSMIVFSVLNKSHPVPIFSETLDRPHAIYLGGGKDKNRLAFLGYFGKSRIYNISDPFHPSLKFEQDHPTISYISDIQVRKNHFYVSFIEGFEIWEYGSIGITGTPVSPNDCGVHHDISISIHSSSGEFLNETISLRVIGGNMSNVVDKWDGCHVLSCNGVFTNDTELSVCGGNGNCTFTLHDPHGKCVCKNEGFNETDFCGSCSSGFFGDECLFHSCFGIRFNDTTEVCSGHGNCTRPNECECQHNYTSADCSMWYCNQTARNEIHNTSCSGHGRCVASDVCVCDDDTVYFSQFCETFACFGVFNNETAEVCSKHGSCIDHDTCICDHGYNTSQDCSEFTCFSIASEEEGDVCSGHGTCTDYDLCECDTNFRQASDCSVWSCNGIWNNVSSGAGGLICSGHGKCESFDTCDCLSDVYSGIDCQYWSCFGIPASNVDSACFGHGACVSRDLCGCQSGYYASTGVFGDICDMWKCGLVERHKKHVCNGRGNCTASQNCNCFGEFEGDYCETWSCSGIDQKLEIVCSGNGKCEAPEKCKCRGQYTGDECGTNMLYFSVMTPLLSVFALTSLLGGLGVVCVCIICACLGCCCVVLICGIILQGQRKKVKRFSKLKDFDLLMEEQNADQDSSVAHLKVNKTLFEVDMKEIKIQKILGEGGSASVVYKASWRGNIIAFKCFKTRQIASSQADFDEFEREVNVLASLSHPFIIQFFGACLCPPRVGILMEYCEKGDLLVFLRTYDLENGKQYPYHQKLRMASEIASSFEYVHSRNVIHRDLKLENVLISQQESCKLMDFGLSKIVDRMSQMKTKSIGTSVYMSPEICFSETYDEKCDVFSYSILLYILFSENYFPYGKNSMNVEMRVAQDPKCRPDIDVLKKLPCVDVDLIDIICTCWEHDPKNRYSFDKISKLLESIRDGNENGSSNKNNNESEERRSGEKEKDYGKSEIVDLDASNIKKEEDEQQMKRGQDIDSKQNKNETAMIIEELRLENEKLRIVIKKVCEENEHLSFEQLMGT